MADIGKIEYRVRPVTRYIVTRYEQTFGGAASVGGSVAGRGEYDNEATAYEVGYALARADHERLGWPLGDERIKYPDPPGIKGAICAGRIGGGGLSVGAYRTGEEQPAS